MGAWSTGNFSNDTALDFLSGIVTADDIKHPITSVASNPPDYIDADLACEILAAADILAAMLGRPALDSPEQVDALVTKFGKPDPETLSAARTAVNCVLNGSELAELWYEDDGQEWEGVVRDLLSRLNPGIRPKPKETVAPAKGGFICSVCDDFVSDDELVRVEIGFLNMPGITMGRYFHQSCIESNFKPPYEDKKGDVPGSLKKQIKQFLKKKDKDNGAD